LGVPLARACIQVLASLTIALTFYYSEMSGVNSGIISTNFSSSIVFVTLFFHIWYKQVLNKIEVLGCVFIILGVVLIGFGGSIDDGRGSEMAKVSVKFLILASIFGVSAGLVTSLNSVSMKFHVQEMGFPPEQMIMDGNFIVGIVLLPFFLNHQIKSEPFSTGEIVQGFIFSWGISLSFTLFTFSLNYGKAGIAQSIENTKVIF